ncbi:zinc-binding dehydrogenase [Actinomycetospora endophytica]|uniref:Zinc-binding dehydrogenase n=1 Tax=Actinomycetospora endophytica TaxID=2291215 RepID=A0ABS8PA00_9PSEU|nr:zinc-binding dehydrogenase [Actinomycetospora endophytica]MCD2195102.1 zinc-binding dehydrogenase [Actinomycetospora endophytica]
MWAQRLTAPSHFEPCETRAPSPSDLAPGQVLLRTTAGGICGSDLPFFRGGTSPDAPPERPSYGSPGFPMHEVVGEVVASAHPEHTRGDAVVGWASGFDGIAEQVVSTGDGLHRYADDLLPWEAVTIQPLACALYAVEQLGPLEGRSVAVLGQGPIGLLFSHLASGAGASRVIGVDRVERADVAATFGVDETVHAPVDRWLATLSSAERPDVVVEAIGHQTGTLNQAVDAVAFGGEIFYFGVADDLVYPFAMRTFLRKNLTLRSGVALERRRVLAAADEHLRTHPELRERYITHILDVEDVQAAFDRAAAPTTGQTKIVLTMP